MPEQPSSADETRAVILAGWALVTILALVLGVGLVSSGVLRHLVQTIPSWLTVYLGFRRHTLAKWTALPVCIFWFGIMVCIWLYLLGWARMVTGHFTGIEIAMTIIVGGASVFAFIQALRMKSASSWWICLLIMAATLFLQLAAFRLSLLPGIANH
jgi:hypothetical protein